MWAFTEAFVGGILHAIQIPFKGLILSSIAVLLITMISKFTKQRGAILKAATLVMIIKGMIAPHTPPSAYFAIFFQGVMGELIYYKKTTHIVQTTIFALIVALQSGVQRIITLTIFYGENIWKAINVLINYVIAQFKFLNVNSEINFSVIIISIYISIHLIGGIIVGFLTHKIINRVYRLSTDEGFLNEIKIISTGEELNIKTKKKKNKKFKYSYLIIVLLSAVLIYLSLTNQLNANIVVMDVLIMLFRAVVIILLWYFVLAPYAKKFINKLLKRRKNKYAKEVDNLLEFFPYLKNLLGAIWKYSSNKKLILRLKFLIDCMLVMYLFTEDSND